VSKSGRPPFVAPSSPAEQALAEIWSRVLDIRTVGIHDDFFQLGGDSFAAATLLAEVQKEFSASAHLLETIDFLDSPTIAHVASVLQGGSAAMPGMQAGPGHPWAVALQPRGSNPALFVVPGIGENSIYLLPLARHLGQERPVYAFRDPRRAEERGLYSLEDVAERYVQAVRAVQPHGPYLLSGHCLGGVVAFEMAQCLVAAGEQVGLLALIETATPRYPNFTRHCSLCLAELRRQLIFFSQGRISAGRLLEGARRVGGHIWRQVRRSLERLKVRDWPGRPVEPAISVEQANLRAARWYVPRMYPGRIAILGVEDHLQTGSLLDRRLGWRELAAGGIEVHSVPGDHFTSFVEPNVRELAARLRTLANRAICASGNPRTV
jgi:thioesterase domain-containing protein